MWCKTARAEGLRCDLVPVWFCTCEDSEGFCGWGVEADLNPDNHMQCLQEPDGFTNVGIQVKTATKLQGFQSSNSYSGSSQEQRCVFPREKRGGFFLSPHNIKVLRSFAKFFLNLFCL